MITIPEIRSKTNRIIILGNHEPIIQSMLDFDYLSGKTTANVSGIVTGRSGYAKYFFGADEVLIPTFTSFPHGVIDTWFFNLTSGRRAAASSADALREGALGGVIFAENTPEVHSLELIKATGKAKALVIGPASVGLLIPGILKIGPIGGITPEQVDEGKLTEKGHIAVISGSGGMTNELIGVAIQAGHRLSFALSYGGDRFPVLAPKDAFMLAESDPETQAVLYYGELGGEDEYELVQLKETGKFTKQVIAHIAGTVADLFPESPQFGHAKAKADNKRATAQAKREALRSVGFQVSNSFSEFITLVATLDKAS